MSGDEDRQGLFPLTLLLFSVGGVRFACATGQVLGTTAYADDEHSPEDAPLWFHRAVEFTRDPAYVEPTAVLVKPRGQEVRRVIIDAMEEIVEVGPDEIRPFPALLEPLARSKGMWGVYPRNGRMFFLVDLERLANTKRTCLG